MNPNTTPASRTGVRGCFAALIGAVSLLCATASLAAEATQENCRLYDPNPQHLWNRLHETLFVRTSPEGDKYGCDRIDPLFWTNTKYLLVEPSHTAALRILDEFLDKRGEKLIRDPLKRAFLQHDLWTLFDWSASSWRDLQFGREGQVLQKRLAAIIQGVALTTNEIASLPDNYSQSETNNLVTTLPRSLFQQDGDWVNVGINGDGTVAPAHAAAFGGRSVFQIKLRVPEGRKAAISYLEQLRGFEHPWIYTKSSASSPEMLVMNPALPQFPTNTQWALVRRMCVIDTEGHIQPTTITESIQVRRYIVVPAATTTNILSRESPANAQQFAEFVASRTNSGALRSVAQDEKDFVFVQFMSHGIDPFEIPKEQRARWGPDSFSRSLDSVLKTCATCHSAPGIHSVQSYARLFGPQSLQPPGLLDADEAREAVAMISWKHQQYDWGLLQGLWRRIR